MTTRETRREAHAAARPNAATLRARVLEFVRSRGEQGATDEEIQHALGMAGNTQRPRRAELAAADMLRASGKRKTSSGRSAAVWIATTQAERDLEAAPLYIHGDGQTSLFPPDAGHEPGIH